MKAGTWIRAAFKEFFINILISTVPFWVGILIWTLAKSFNLSLTDALYKIASNGELVIYSATLMAPIAYAVVKDPPVKFKVFFQFCSTLVICLGIVIYVIGIFDGFNEDIVKFSFICFLISILIYLAVLLIQNELHFRESATKIREDQMKQTIKDYGKHRGVQP